MLMLKSDGMTKLMKSYATVLFEDRGACVDPAKIHSCVADCDELCVLANIRPRSGSWVERDADISVLSRSECEVDVDVLHPLFDDVSNFSLLDRGSLEWPIHEAIGNNLGEALSVN